MKILQVHNQYQKRGGEESVLQEEKKVLENHGHSVVQFLKDSRDLSNYSKLSLVRMMLSQRKSKLIAGKLRDVITLEKPDICHVHNVFPLISPVVYEVCNEIGLPLVQTIHNYKLICSNGLLFRNGRACEECISNNLYHSIKHKCYRQSALATALQADSVQHHREIGTWQTKIDRYLCLTEFQKEKLVQGGLPADKISIKPNFTQNKGERVTSGNYFLVIGRLEEGKGLYDLVELFRSNKTAYFKLVGECDQPDIFAGFENVEYLGKKNREELKPLFEESRTLIFPSKLYEGMPMSIIEAFSFGRPVIARDHGAMSTMIENGITGLKYSSIEELCESVAVLERDRSMCEKMGVNALFEFEERYSEEIGYKNLIEVYGELIDG